MLELFSIVPPGLEKVAATEAASLGATVAGQVTGGLDLTGDVPTLIRLHLGARIPSRILVRLLELPLPAYRKALGTVDFGAFLPAKSPFLVEVAGGGARPSELSRPLEEALLRKGYRRARPGEEAPAFHVRLAQGTVTLSLDASGAHLHQRGYRQETGAAPLRENLAAGILALAGYDPGKPLLDPMCGSGTFLIEGAMIALNRAPGLQRTYAFEQWPCVSGEVLEAERSALRSREAKTPPAPILGSDRNAGALGVARRNAQRAGVLPHLKLERRDVLELVAPASSGLLVTNPPYGKRVGEVRELLDLHTRFGALLRERFSGWTIAVFLSDPRLEEAMGLPVREVHPLRNGGLACRLVIADL